MGPIEALAHELMLREVNAPKQEWRKRAPSSESGGGMSPDLLHTIGGLADAGSTYYFLKRKQGAEGNRLMGFTNSHPEATALGAVGGLLATKGIKKLLAKKFPAMADALAANLGAQQLALAVTNLDDSKPSSMREYRAAMQRAAMR